MKAQARVSLRAFARRKKVAHNSVVKAVKSGRLSTSIGRDAKDRPFIADVTLADTEWNQNTGRGGPKKPKAQIVSKNTLVEAQRSATLERARKFRLENDLMEGRVVLVSKAAREAFESGRTIRKAILNIPARISAELAAETDPGRVYGKLDGALREALNSTADRLMAVGE